MSMTNSLKPRRSYKPAVVSLEDRLTPTVNSLIVAGLAPSPTGTGKVSIVGVLSESDSNLLSGMTLTYTVTDAHGEVLATGPLKMGRSLPNSTLTSFYGTASFSASRGDVEMIRVDAMESMIEAASISPLMNEGLSATAELTLPSTKGTTNMGLGATENNGDHYSGSASGRLSVSPLDGGGLVAKGSGAINFASDPANDTQIGARGNGNFTFGIGPKGNIGLIVNKGRGLLQTGTDAGDTSASGGLTLKAAGYINITRHADESICATADGSLSLSARTGSDLTARDGQDSTGTNITGTARNVKIAFKTDGAGKFKLGLSGKLNLSGTLGSSLGLPI